MGLLADVLHRLESLRDSNDHRHEQHVGAVSMAIARLMGIPRARATAIGNAAMLHDVGKLVIPDAVLHKAGSLSTPESEMIKMHPKLGFDLLHNEERPHLRLAATIALHHHEHADGTGYPNRLTAKEIPIEARIVSLADAYCALREPRAYKSPMTHAQALKIIVCGDGRLTPEHFDKHVLRAVTASPKAIGTAYANC